MKLGILWIDPDRVIFQKSVLGILYGYSIFSVISFRVIDAWYSEFSIIGCARYYQGFLSSVFWLILRATLSMQYNRNSIAELCYQSVLFSIVQRLIQPEVQKISIFWLLISQLEGPTYSASYLNWYKFHLCPLCVQFAP